MTNLSQELEFDQAPLVIGAGLAAEDAPLERKAELPVSEHAIRVWCAAIGETAPAFHDDAAAQRLGLPGVVAPEAMLQTWTVPVSAAARKRQPTLHSEVRARARAAGLGNVVATDYEQTYLERIRPGDRLVERSWVDTVSPVKRTTLGVGVFVTIALDLFRDDGTRVGRMRSRTFYFDPSNAKAEAAGSATGSPCATGEALPPLEVLLDRELVISAALASNDHELVHLDHERAREQGLSDIIVSIVTTAGLVLRYAGERLPSDSVVHDLRLNLARPAVPGDTLRFTGHLVEDAGMRRLEVIAAHGRGVHARASVGLR